MPKGESNDDSESTGTRVTRSLRKRLVSADQDTPSSPKRITKNSLEKISEEAVTRGKTSSPSPEQTSENSASSQNPTGVLRRTRRNGSSNMTSLVDENVMRTPVRKTARRSSLSEDVGTNLTPIRRSRRISCDDANTVPANDEIKPFKVRLTPIHMEEPVLEENEVSPGVRTRSMSSSPRTVPSPVLKKGKAFNSFEKDIEGKDENIENIKNSDTKSSLAKLEKVEDENVSPKNEDMDESLKDKEETNSSLHKDKNILREEESGNEIDSRNNATENKNTSGDNIEENTSTTIPIKIVAFGFNCRTDDEKTPSKFPKTPITSKSKSYIENSPQEDSPGETNNSIQERQVPILTSDKDKEVSNLDKEENANFSMNTSAIVATDEKNVGNVETPKGRTKCLSSLSSSTPILGKSGNSFVQEEIESNAKIGTKNSSNTNISESPKDKTKKTDSDVHLESPNKFVKSSDSKMEKGEEVNENSECKMETSGENSKSEVLEECVSKDRVEMTEDDNKSLRDKVAEKEESEKSMSEEKMEIAEDNNEMETNGDNSKFEKEVVEKCVSKDNTIEMAEDNNNSSEDKVAENKETEKSMSKENMELTEDNIKMETNGDHPKNEKEVLEKCVFKGNKMEMTKDHNKSSEDQMIEKEEPEKSISKENNMETNGDHSKSENADPEKTNEDSSKSESTDPEKSLSKDNLESVEENSENSISNSTTEIGDKNNMSKKGNNKKLSKKSINFIIEDEQDSKSNGQVNLEEPQIQVTSLEDVVEVESGDSNEPKTKLNKQEQKSYSLVEKVEVKENLSFSKSWSQSIKGRSSKDGKDFIDGYGIVNNKESDRKDKNNTPEKIIRKGKILRDNSDSDDEGDGETDSCPDKCEFIDDEAIEANSDDTMDSSERNYIEQNEIPELGESIGSEDTESNEIDEDDEDEDDENDSFIVSDVEEEKMSVDTDEDNISLDDDISEESDTENKKRYKKIRRIEISSDEEVEFLETNKETEENRLKSDNADSYENDKSIDNSIISLENSTNDEPEIINSNSPKTSNSVDKPDLESIDIEIGDSESASKKANTSLNKSSLVSDDKEVVTSPTLKKTDKSLNKSRTDNDNIEIAGSPTHTEKEKLLSKDNKGSEMTRSPSPKKTNKSNIDNSDIEMASPTIPTTEVDTMENISISTNINNSESPKKINELDIGNNDTKMIESSTALKEDKSAKKSNLVNTDKGVESLNKSSTESSNIEMAKSPIAKASVNYVERKGANQSSSSLEEDETADPEKNDNNSTLTQNSINENISDDRTNSATFDSRIEASEAAKFNSNTCSVKSAILSGNNEEEESSKGENNEPVSKINTVSAEGETISITRKSAKCDNIDNVDTETVQSVYEQNKTPNANKKLNKSILNNENVEGSSLKSNSTVASAKKNINIQENTKCESENESLNADDFASYDKFSMDKTLHLSDIFHSSASSDNDEQEFMNSPEESKHMDRLFIEEDTDDDENEESKTLSAESAISDIDKDLKNSQLENNSNDNISSKSRDSSEEDQQELNTIPKIIKNYGKLSLPLSENNLPEFMPKKTDKKKRKTSVSNTLYTEGVAIKRKSITKEPIPCNEDINDKDTNKIENIEITPSMEENNKATKSIKLSKSLDESNVATSTIDCKDVSDGKKKSKKTKLNYGKLSLPLSENNLPEFMPKKTDKKKRKTSVSNTLYTEGVAIKRKSITKEQIPSNEDINDKDTNKNENIEITPSMEENNKATKSIKLSKSLDESNVATSSIDCKDVSDGKKKSKKSKLKSSLRHVENTEEVNDDHSDININESSKPIKKKKKKISKLSKSPKSADNISQEETIEHNEPHKKKLKKQKNTDPLLVDKSKFDSILSRCEQILKTKEEMKKKAKLENKTKKLKKKKIKRSKEFEEESVNQEIVQFTLKSKHDVDKNLEALKVVQETTKTVQETAKALKKKVKKTLQILEQIDGATTENKSNSRKRSASDRTLEEQNPKKKKKLNILEIVSASGIFREESLTPKSTKQLQDIIESDATPKPIGHKVKSLLNTDEYDYTVQKVKRRKRKLEISEPVTLLPKPKWTSSGEFIVTKLPKSGTDPYNIRSSSSSSVTEFNVEPLKVKRKSDKTNVEHQAMQFKKSALFNDKIKRETSKQLLQRKKRQETYNIY